MTGFKFFLAFCLTVTGVFARAGELDPQVPQREPVPALWTDLVCQKSSKQVCVIAQGWAWLRKVNVVIEPGLTVAALSSATLAAGLVASKVIGETPAVVYVITVSRAGVQAGFIVLVGGLVVAVIGTIFSSAGFLLATTTSTAGPELDEVLGRECRETLEPFKGADGLERLLRLTPEEMERVLPCIPKDKDLDGFFKNLSKSQPGLENQIHAN